MSYYHTGCPDCGHFSFVDNYHDGDTVCTQCGLVVQSHILVDDYFYNINSFDDHFELKQDDEMLNIETHKKFEASCIHLQVCDNIKEEARKIFNNINESKHFRGRLLQAAIGCCIYISYNLSGTKGIIRDAKEIYDPLGIDASVFHKALKTIYEIFPDLTKRMTIVSGEDTIVRKIQGVSDIPVEKMKELQKEIKVLEQIRAKHNLLMGSSPSIINSILIFVACEVLNIPVDKKKYITEVGISRATLDKHSKLIRQFR